MCVLDQQEKSAKEHLGTVLIVDDEENILASLKRILRRLKCEALTATSGLEGLEILKSHKVDLVISDMRMPQMDGATFLAEVAKHYPKTKRMVLTGFADMESTIKAINEGNVHNYMHKPWADDELKMTIKEFLEEQSIRAENRKLQKIVEEQNEKLKNVNEELEKKVEERTSVLKKAMEMIEQSNAKHRDSFYAIIPIFSNLIELKLSRKRNHTRDIAELSAKIAEKVGLNTDEVKEVYFSALMRNIGKIGLPEGLLSKPYAKMSTEELVQFHKHPVFAEKILLSIEHFTPVAKILRSQNEYFNGIGFPDRVQKEDIHIGARILCLVREFFALQEGYIEERIFTVLTAQEYIRNNSGIKYDPQLVEYFDEVIEGWKKENATEEIISPEELEEGMVLSRDLYSDSGILLLTKDKKLNADMIEKIKHHAQEWTSLKQVPIYEREKQTMAV